MKELIKLSFKQGMQNCLRALSIFNPAFKIPIFCYHSIDNDDKAKYLSISKEDFFKQMLYLKRNGYTTMSLLDLYKSVNACVSTCISPNESTYDNKQFNKKFIITFDDGFLNNYTNAFPILKYFNFSATFFIITGYIGKNAKWLENFLRALIYDFDSLSDYDLAHITHKQLDADFAKKKASFLYYLDPKQLQKEVLNIYNTSKAPMLSWKKIKIMSHHGMEFGTHTITHPFLDGLSLEDLKKEIIESKKQIEEQIEKSVDFFASPFGNFGINLKQLLKNANYKGACSSSIGHFNLKKDDLFNMPRIPPEIVTSDSEFKFYLSKNCDQYFALKKFLNHINDL